MSTTTPGCPHCGHDEYYRRMRISGESEYRYNFDGKTAAYNGHIHENLDYVEQKTMYCCQCHKKVGVAK